MKHLLAAMALVCAGTLWADDPGPAPGSQAPESAATAGNDRPNCLTETGSRIKRSAEQPCISAPGQVITRDDIGRTGEINTADALRKLAPAIR